MAFGDDVQKVLEGAVSSKVRDDLDGQVFQSDGAQKIVLFRKSNILTYIALVKAANDNLEDRVVAGKEKSFVV